VSQYQELDQRIISAICARRNPLYANTVAEEASRLSELTGREGFRVIDGRLQALRKAGRIRHLSKAESNGAGGWHVADAAIAAQGRGKGEPNA
jgi:hypothetical protein